MAEVREGREQNRLAEFIANFAELWLHDNLYPGLTITLAVADLQTEVSLRKVMLEKRDLVGLRWNVEGKSFLDAGRGQTRYADSSR